MARLGQAVHGCVVGTVAAQVDEDAVGAVGVRVAELLAGDRNEPLALLARRLGQQLLGPEAEAREPAVGNDGHLVAAGPAEPAERRAQGRTGMDLGPIL